MLSVSRDSSDRLVTSLQNVRSRDYSFPARATDLYIHQNMYTGCAAHPASIRWMPRDFFPGAKRLDPEAHRQLPI